MKILFICRHNTCRSILAEAIARQYLPKRFEVASAGSEPLGDINPHMKNYIRAMGQDPADFHSKSWEEVTEFHPDIVISVCDQLHGEVCPTWLADGIRVNWELSNSLDSCSSQEQFDERCHVASVSLRRRIVKLGGYFFENMTHDEIVEALEQQHEM